MIFLNSISRVLVEAWRVRSAFQNQEPGRGSSRHRRASITLVQHDADALRLNLDLLKTEYENLIKSDLPNYRPTAVRWNWRNVPLNTCVAPAGLTI
jgi:hypothetical protein